LQAGWEAAEPLEVLAAAAELVVAADSEGAVVAADSVEAVDYSTSARRRLLALMARRHWCGEYLDRLSPPAVREFHRSRIAGKYSSRGHVTDSRTTTHGALILSDRSRRNAAQRPLPP
jgi:hypothetical protein